MHEGMSEGSWKIFTILGAMDSKGILATVTVGARIVCLPPCSPDLNPIEKAWAKLKQQLRAYKVRSVEALDQAIAVLLPTISPQDATA